MGEQQTRIDLGSARSDRDERIAALSAQETISSSEIRSYLDTEKRFQEAVLFRYPQSVHTLAAKEQLKLAISDWDREYHDTALLYFLTHIPTNFRNKKEYDPVVGNFFSRCADALVESQEPLVPIFSFPGKMILTRTRLKKAIQAGVGNDAIVRDMLSVALDYHAHINDTIKERFPSLAEERDEQFVAHRYHQRKLNLERKPEEHLIELHSFLKHKDTITAQEARDLFTVEGNVVREYRFRNLFDDDLESEERQWLAHDRDLYYWDSGNHSFILITFFKQIEAVLRNRELTPEEKKSQVDIYRRCCKAIAQERLFPNELYVLVQGQGNPSEEIPLWLQVYDAAIQYSASLLNSDLLRDPTKRSEDLNVEFEGKLDQLCTPPECGS